MTLDKKRVGWRDLLNRLQLAGILPELNVEKIEQSQEVIKSQLNIDKTFRLKEIYIKSPTLLTQEKIQLDERFDCLLNEFSFEMEDIEKRLGEYMRLYL